MPIGIATSTPVTEGGRYIQWALYLKTKLFNYFDVTQDHPVLRLPSIRDRYDHHVLQPGPGPSNNVKTIGKQLGIIKDDDDEYEY